jgi:hypothetical protein
MIQATGDFRETCGLLVQEEQSVLRNAGRTIVPEYCQHCYFLGDARAKEAGFTMRLEGGNGTCVHTYCHAGAATSAQDLGRIREVT